MYVLPQQLEYPVWHFPYGMLADSLVFPWIIGLDHKM